MADLPIPPSSPEADYIEYAEAIEAALRRVLVRGSYILGDEVSGFENEFADFHGVPYAIGVGNGTDAISIALRALGVGQGDAVITVSHTATATVSAIRSVGAIPVFVDVDDEWGVMDVECLEELLSEARRGGGTMPIERFKAIVPVHLYGHCADVKSICGIASVFGLKVVEDCAQAHGAITKEGKLAGTLGAFGTFSFYPTKNLSAIGDAGALVTADTELAKRARMIRQYGWDEHRLSRIDGVNSRLDELQAAVLRVKLPFLNSANIRRGSIAKRYSTMLGDTSLHTPRQGVAGRHVYHQYPIRSQHRDDLRAFLQQHNIATLIHYPVPVHLQPAFATHSICPSGGLPRTERWALEELSLPVFPQLSDEQATRVGEEVLRFMGA